MRLSQVPKKLLLVPLVLTVLLAALLASRFTLELYILFAISFSISLILSLIVFFIIFKPVNLGTFQSLVYQRNGRLVDPRLQGGLVLARRLIDQPIVVDMRIQSISADEVPAITLDPVEVTLSYFLQWHVINPVFFTALPASWKNDLSTIVLTRIQNHFSPLDVRTLLANRGAIANDIEYSLKYDPVLLAWGIRVVHFGITTLDIPNLVKDLLTREFVARFVTPALVREGQNTANTYAAIQAIAGGDAALLQILKTVNETFGKK